MDAIREAYAREESLRAEAFLEFPETVCGLPLVPLTLHHLIVLEQIGCPFLKGGVPKSGDFGAVFWLLHPRYRPLTGPWWRRWWARRARRRVLVKVGRVTWGEAFAGLKGYFERALMDLPTGGNDRPPFALFAAGYVNTLARTYGWSEREILEMPFRRVTQYVRHIIDDAHTKVGKRAIFFNRYSDAAKAEACRN